MSFKLDKLENFFEKHFYADLSIKVPVCFMCHQHLYKKPAPLTGCECRICYKCALANFSSLPECPNCGENTENIKEIETYCGQTINVVCKSCYQTKHIREIFKCSKGCPSCFECVKKYSDPDPQCPVCNVSLPSSPVKTKEENQEESKEESKEEIKEKDS